MEEKTSSLQQGGPFTSDDPVISAAIPAGRDLDDASIEQRTVICVHKWNIP